MLFAAVTGLGLLSAPALAQDAAGKFTLTKEVRWGSAVLPAGDYQYSLEHRAGALLLLRNTNGQMGAIVLVKSTTAVNDQGPARLVLERSGDGWFVSSMVITEIGEELSFGAPSLRTEAAKKGTSSPARVASLSNP